MKVLPSTKWQINTDVCWRDDFWTKGSMDTICPWKHYQQLHYLNENESTSNVH